MIKEQNYIKIGQYTKKAFQLFCKRRLAAQILQLLARPKAKKDYVVAESQYGIENQSNTENQDKKMQSEQSEPKTSNIRFARQSTVLKDNSNETYISNIYYGDFVSIELQRDKQAYKMTEVLDHLKLLSKEDIVSNIVFQKKCCFQICSPFTDYKQKKEVVTSESMICLKNVFNGLYIHLTQELSLNKKFGYLVKFKPEMTQEAIVRFISCRFNERLLQTDHQVQISSYYKRNLFLTLSQQNLEQLYEKTIIASFSAMRFRVLKQKKFDWKSPPYYYLQCRSINSNFQGEHQSFHSQLIRKQYNRLEIDLGGNPKKSISYHQVLNFYQIGKEKQTRQVRIQEINQNSLYQVWEIQKSKTSDVCRIKNVVTNQSLNSEHLEVGEIPAYRKRNSILKIQKQQGNQYKISQDNNNLSAVYDPEKDRYVVRFQNVMHSSTHVSSMSRNSIYQFELVQLPQYKCHILTHLVKAFYLLKYNYQFFEKWGWIYEERDYKIRYSLTDLKKGLYLMRQKVKEVLLIIQRTTSLMFTYQNHKLMFQDMAQQMHILEMFILYSKTINLKMGSEKDRNQQMYSIAFQELKVVHQKIFDLLFLLVQNNKNNSEIIIQHSKFFNYLLSLYPETVGGLLQESIKNLCMLTNKTSKEQTYILQWASLIEHLQSHQQIDIQRKFIDILSQVAVDPWDIGISHYQNKIKQQLFNRNSNNKKKKLFPKFIQNAGVSLDTPHICFQYPNFPIPTKPIQHTQGLVFPLSVFKRFQSHSKYVCSILKLLRNLCKDRNRKMPKVIEQLGLTQSFMNNSFKCIEIGWQFLIRFLDLYCAVYLIQDPFLCFDRKQVKCFFSQKIELLDFNIKTSILFKQFTQQNIAQQKHKQFDIYIIPLLQRYFRETDDNSTPEGIQNLTVFVNILYSIINYGFLNEASIRQYTSQVIKQAKRVFKADECTRKQKNALLNKTIQLCQLAEQICTIIHGIKILKNIYISISRQTLMPAQKIRTILYSALQDERSNSQQQNPRKRKSSMSKRSENYRFDKQQKFSDSLKLEEFAAQLIIENGVWINSECQKKIMGLLQLLSKRGNHICHFLDEILILNSEQQQTLFLQYSGITPLNCTLQRLNSSNRLLNVMKVKQLVDKITEEGMGKGDQSNKNQKILQLNNLLMKIIFNLQALKKKNYRLFAMCQVLLQKLNLHSILIQILRYQELKNYEEIIGTIIHFYCEFIQRNQTNLTLMTKYFKELTKKYCYKKLPHLLSQLFSKTTNQEESFWLVYNNIQKKMENQHKEILFECVYQILKKCPQELFEKIKGTLLYSLISHKQFSTIIRAEEKFKYPHFIKLLCLVGKGIPATYRMITEIISRGELMEGLTNNQGDYEMKWIYLRLYSFLYIESGVQFDEDERQQLVENVFMKQLRYLPSSCRDKAQKVISKLSHSSKQLNIDEFLQRDKEQIQFQYGSLMMQSNPNMSATRQENYLIYLLNIDEVNEFSMLNCLLLLLQKYEIYSIDVVASYLFKLINFMNKVYVKEDRTFQHKILTALISIGEVITQKYNRGIDNKNSLSFKEAYSIVQSFYFKISQLVRTENVTFSQMLQCAGVSYVELDNRRLKNCGTKLIRQAEFSEFIRNLSLCVNNRYRFDQKLTEGAIKLFFEQVKQKDSNKMNLLVFLSKLLQVIENDKTKQISKKVNNKNSQDYFENEYDKATKYTNSELIHREIQQYKKVYELRLKSTMLHRIQRCVQKVLGSYEQQYPNAWSAQKISNLFELLIIGEKYHISSIIIEIIIQKIDSNNILYMISEKLRDKYLRFVLNKFELTCDHSMIGIIIEIYNKHDQHTNVQESIEQTAFRICENETKGQPLLNNNQTDLEYLKKLYLLFSNCIKSAKYGQHLNILVQKKISFLFMHSYHNFFAQQKHEHFEICIMLLQKMMEIFDSFQIIASQLSNNKQFLGESSLLLKKYLQNGIMCTNLQNQRYSKLIYKYCLLLIKMKARHVEIPILMITNSWPIDLIASTFKTSYAGDLMPKIQKGLKCNRKQYCSLQFCNDELLTSFDGCAVETMTSFLIVVQIISQMQVCLFQKPKIQNGVILEQFKNYLSGKMSNANKQDIKIFQVTQKIEVKSQKGEVSTIYFSVPSLNKFRKSEFQEQLNEQINLFKKQAFIQNLDHFSFLVQRKLQEHQEGSYGFIQRNYNSISSILQLLFILYLYICCIFSLFFISQKPKTLLFIFNTFVIILKSLMFARTFRKFINQKKTLVNITYDKNEMFWKLIRLISSFIVIILYCFIYTTQIIFPVILILEAYQIKSLEEMLIISLRAFKHGLIIMTIISILLFCYSFVLFGLDYSQSILQIFIGLQRQMILYSIITIDESSPSFPILKYHPVLIPILYTLLLVGQSIFIASLVHSLFKNRQLKTKNDKSCRICKCTKLWCEQRNINYAKHISKDHSPWTYIYFFIYMRREEVKGPLLRKLKESIQIQDFQFLKPIQNKAA